MHFRILIVDDDANIRFVLSDYLREEGYIVDAVGSIAEALERFQHYPADGVLLDFRLPDGTALDLIPRLRAMEQDLPIIVLTAYGSIDAAVQAVREGAENFLTKPVELPSLTVLLQRALDKATLQRKQIALETRQQRKAIDPFLGVSRQIRKLAETSRKIAAFDSPVLILGETGTGKGVLARWLHENSSRRNEAFVDLNCAGLSREFLDTELFGHEKGAFTGAIQRKLGLLEVGHRGTVFLDEIGDMVPEVQPKLLKVLEEKKFRRMGEIKDRIVDIRLIAATHQDLSERVQREQFRSDLYFRINTITLEIPPLRERLEDLPILAQNIINRLASELSRQGISLHPLAQQALQSYHWPGNVRELRNVLERAILLCNEDTIHPDDLFFQANSNRQGRTLGGTSLGQAHAANSNHHQQHSAEGANSVPRGSSGDIPLKDLERLHIVRVLDEEQGKVARAAKRLGIPESTLYFKIKKLGLRTDKV